LKDFAARLTVVTAGSRRNRCESLQVQLNDNFSRRLFVRMLAGVPLIGVRSLEVLS
jgi:hypothetical protein